MRIRAKGPILAIVAILISTNLAHSRGIHFETGITWLQVKEKAKKEKKFIFVDCYATWCGPCKEMDQRVYPDSTTGVLMNQLFLSVKVQMDSTKADDETVKAWYADARQLRSELEINSYPTYLFFTPNGEIIHRATSAMNPHSFQKLALDAVYGDKQLYVLLNQYKAKQLPLPQLPDLISALQWSGQSSLCQQVQKDYIEHYLLKLPEELLYTRENAFTMMFYLTNCSDPSDKVFQMFAHERDKVDKAFNYPGGDKAYQAGTYPFIDRNDVKPWLSTQADKEPAWGNLSVQLRKKYGPELSDEVVLDAQIDFYERKKMSAQKNKYMLQRLDRFGVDRQPGDSNDHIYELFAANSDPKVLGRLLAFQKRIIDQYPNNPESLDTYANILYRLNRREEAVAAEEKAMRYRPKSKDIASNLEKMRAGKPTWNDK